MPGTIWDEEVWNTSQPPADEQSAPSPEASPSQPASVWDASKWQSPDAEADASQSTPAPTETSVWDASKWQPPAQASAPVGQPPTQQSEPSVQDVMRANQAKLAQQLGRAPTDYETYRQNLTGSPDAPSLGEITANAVKEIPDTLPVRTVEQAGANLVGNVSNVLLTAGNEVVTAAGRVVGKDTSHNPFRTARDAINGSLQEYAQHQEDLDKQGLLGETLTGALRQAGGMIGEMAVLPEAKIAEGAGWAARLATKAAPLVGYMTASGSARSLAESDQQKISGPGKYASAAVTGAIDGASALLMVAFGSGLGKLASGESQGVVQQAVQSLTDKYSLSAPVSKLVSAAGEGGSQVGFNIGTNIAHYLNDVAFGRRKWNSDDLLKTLEQGDLTAAIAGAGGGALHSYYHDIVDTIDQRIKELPEAVKQAAKEQPAPAEQPAETTDTSASPPQQSADSVPPPEPPAASSSEPYHDTPELQAERDSAAQAIASGDLTLDKYREQYGDKAANEVAQAIPAATPQQSLNLASLPDSEQHLIVQNYLHDLEAGGPKDPAIEKLFRRTKENGEDSYELTTKTLPNEPPAPPQVKPPSEPAASIPPDVQIPDWLPENDLTRRLNGELEATHQEETGVEQPPSASFETAKTPDQLERDAVASEQDSGVQAPEPPKPTEKERTGLRKEVNQLRRREILPQSTLDDLTALDHQDQRDIIDSAKQSAAVHNDYMDSLRQQYRDVYGSGKARGLASARAAKKAARGADETSVKRYDQIAEDLRQPQYAELAAETDKAGGILATEAGGAKQFADIPHDEYIGDILRRHQDAKERASSEARSASENLGAPQERPADAGSGGESANARPEEVPQAEQVAPFSLSREESPDKAPVVAPYQVPEADRVGGETRRGEHQPLLLTELEKNSAAGQQGLFAEKPAKQPNHFDDFAQAQQDYRSGKTGDEEFLAAKSRMDSQLRTEDRARGEEPPLATAKRDAVVKQVHDEFGIDVHVVEPERADHHDAVVFAKQRGVNVVFFRTDDGSPTVYGFASQGGDTVFINADHRGNALWGLIGHEMTHSTGFDVRSKADVKLVDAAFDRYMQNGDVPDAYRKRLEAEPKLRRAEGIAQLVQELFESKSFRKQIKGENPGLWARLVKAIKTTLGSYTPYDKFSQEVLDEFGIKQPPTADGGKLAFSFGPDQTGTKNEVSEAERKRLGLPARVVPAADTVEGWARSADAAFARDPKVGQKLVDELNQYPRAVGPVEDSILRRHKVDLMNQLEAAVQANDRPERKRITLEYKKAIEANERVGAVWGKSGRSRQELQAADYTLAGRGARLSRAVDRDLTDGEWKQVEADSDHDKELQGKIDGLEDAAAEEETKGGHQASIDTFKDLNPPGGKGGKGGGGKRGGGGGGKAPASIAELLDKVGPDSTSAELSNVAREMAKRFIEQGYTNRDVVIDKVHGVLSGAKDEFGQSLLPGLTRRQTMDAISLYGQFSELNKEPVAKRLREIAGESQQIAKLLDMEAGNAPLKTGMERREPTDEERRLIRLVNEAKKKYNIEAKDPARQLKSALDAVKTRLKNQIRDYDNAIQSNEKLVTDRAALPYDAEANDLKSKRDELKAMHDSIFGDDKMSDAQRIKLALTAIERASNETARRIAEKDFSRQGPDSSAWSPEISVEKAKLAAQRALLDELKANDPESQADANMRANFQLRRVLADKRARLAEKMDAGDYTRDPAKAKRFTDDPQTVAAKQELATFRAQFDKRVWEIERRRNLAAEKADLDQQLQSGEYKPPPERKVRDKPRDIQEMERQVQERRRIKNKALVEAASSGGSKFTRLMLKVRRAFVLSSPVVFEKIASIAALRAAEVPFREALGVGFGKIIPEIAKRAPIEGGMSVDALAKAATKALTSSGREAWKLIKTGRDSIDEAAGKAGLPPEATELLGRVHGATRAPLKTFIYEHSLEKINRWAIRNGLDPTDPVVQTGAVADAYAQTVDALLLGSNVAVDGYNALLGRLEQPSKVTGKATIGGKVTSAALQVALPIVRIPTNYVSQAMGHVTGLFTGSAEAAGAYRRGVESLKPGQADQIMRHLKAGAPGLAVLALGFWARNNIGGYYQPGKKDKDGPQFGGARIFGWDVPRVLLHTPLLECLQIGATIGRVWDSKLHKKDQENQSLWDGAIAAAIGLTNEAPFGHGIVETGKMLDPSQSHDAINRFIGDAAVPQLSTQAAKYFDKDAAGETIQRKPGSVAQAIEQNIPGLRQNVPEAHPAKPPKPEKKPKLQTFRRPKPKS